MKRFAGALVVVLIVLALAVVLDPTRVVLGKLSGEAFYRDRPTSYWRKELLDPAPGAATNAVHELTEGKAAAVPVLVDLIRTSQGPKPEDADVRLLVAQALGDIGPDARDAKQPLATLLNDPSPVVRIAAADSFGRMGITAVDPDVIGAMAKLVRDDDPAGSVKVIKALRKLRNHNAEATAVLTEAVTKHPDAEVRENSAEALGEMASVSEETEAALRKALKDPNERVREEAEDALKKHKIEVDEDDKPGRKDDPDKN